MGIRPLRPDQQFRDDGLGGVLTPFPVVPLEPLRISQHFSQEKFDLAVQAAQIVVCPALNGIQNVLVDPQQERLAIAHGRYW
jgi:hypothetical protein